MTIRKWLFATTMLMLPLAAEAQVPQEPVLGIYLGAAGGFNIQTSQAVNNIMTNLPGAAGLTTPSTSVSTGIGAAAVGTVGYGLGNGFRVELEGDYRSNGFSSVSGNNRFGTSRSTGAAGSEQVFGPMVNLDYDFINLIPYIVPYVGVGLGYQRAYLHDFTVFGPSEGTTIHSGDNRGSFAVQGILGAAYDIPQVPGLALTAEYRIMALPESRTYNASFSTILPTGFTTRYGKFELGHLLSNTFLFGVRYNFGGAPPPAAPVPVAPPAPVPSRSYLVFFDWDKATLTDRARQIIKEAADNSTRVQYTRIEVNGYTDTSGTPRYNQGLSIRRAQAVAGELVRDGVPQNVITAQGFGDTHLLVSTGPGVREPQNRRVEIIIH